MAFAWVRPKQEPDPEIEVFSLVERKAKNASGQVLRRRYELLEPIAWGGTAAVYKARDRETKALCAVKLLYPGARTRVKSFFGQEARLAARIHSPHLVRASAFGEDRGRPFIVFDLVRGQALAGLYFETPMPWRDLMRVVLQILDALARLHRRGIVHRDVKPDNVIVEDKLGGELHVTLLDFGFAWVPPDRRLTVAPDPSRTVYGTAGFIAPELFAGWTPDPRNDLYSVGALMYSKLTGHAVPDVSAAPELMVIPPTRAFVPSIPEAVDDVVMRALSDIEARFQSAEEMAGAIREMIAAVDRAELLAAISPEVSAPPGDREAQDDESENARACSGSMVSTSATAASERRTTSRALAEPGASGQARPGRRRVWAVAGLSMAALALSTVPGLLEPEVNTPTEPALSSVSSSTESVHVSGTGEPATPEALPEEAPHTLANATTPASQPPTPGVAAAPEVPSRQRTATKHLAAPSFEQRMAALDPRVRRCARDAGLADEPVTVQVVGDAGAISQVRVVHLPAAHPFSRCVDAAVRSAAPPLGDQPLRRHTFFRKP